MAKDARLDRLKALQDLTYKLKQEAKLILEQSNVDFTLAKEQMKNAYQEKQRTFENQEDSWHECQNVYSQNGPQINQLKILQESAYQNMKYAFESASLAHKSSNGISARSHATKGRHYKAESQIHTTKRKRMIEAIKNAESRHEVDKCAFQQAKKHFDEVEREFNEIKIEHIRKQNDLREAKLEFNYIRDEFEKRLEFVKSEAKKRNDYNLEIIRQANIPRQYLNNIYIYRKSDGKINIFFGGMNKPDGPGHGHYIIDTSSGKITRCREPFDPNNDKTDQNSKLDYFDVVLKEISKNWEFRFYCQFHGHPALVESTYSKDHKRRIIIIYYGPNGPFGSNCRRASAEIKTPLKITANKVVNV